MVGRDKLDGSRQRFEQVANELGVRDHITLTGGVPKSEVRGHLNRADVFLNTTSVDNTPVSVLEAMASGLCVVSTNVGGMPHLLTHERDGLLVAANEAEAMAAAVRRILIQPKLAERLSLGARNTAGQFGWSTVLPMWDRLLRSILSPDHH
jgi:glycosyltransferase involved in cell wall biosynthesis